MRYVVVFSPTFYKVSAESFSTLEQAEEWQMREDFREGLTSVLYTYNEWLASTQGGEAELNQAKEEKAGEVRAQAAERVPGGSNGLDVIWAVRTLVKDGSLSDDGEYARDVMLAARAAINTVRALPTLADVLAYDPVNDPNWPTPP